MAARIARYRRTRAGVKPIATANWSDLSRAELVAVTATNGNAFLHRARRGHSADAPTAPLADLLRELADRIPPAAREDHRLTDGALAMFLRIDAAEMAEQLAAGESRSPVSCAATAHLLLRAADRLRECADPADFPLAA